ncbi:MAG: DUF4418 family protein [Lachnospiraceae bacterium]|nr:DUF4418 family protein [Lachnospiraceae bacterium]
MSEKKSIFAWIPAILSGLLIIGTLTVFRACGPKEDGTWMHCHTAQNDIALAGAVIFVLLVAAALIKNRRLSAALFAAAALGCVIVVLIPGTLVSMCMMTTMRCHAVMKMFARIMGVLTAVSSLIAALRMGRGK